MSSFYDPLPIDEYEALNKSNGEAHLKLTDECPTGSLVSGLDIQCGPILRLLGTLENGQENYRASLLLVVGTSDTIPKITYEIGPSAKLESSKLSSGEFPGKAIFSQDNVSFVRYNIDLSLASVEQKVKYAINGTSHSSYHFFVPATQDSMNVVSFSCNGFSLGTDTTDYTSCLWLDVLRKHANPDQHYHVMLGGGDQIYSDAVKLACDDLKTWTSISSTSKKAAFKATSDMQLQLNKFYLYHYLKWFGKGFWVGTKGKTLQPLFPFTMSTIPSVNMFDDHDIIDGFGSYHDSTMSGEVFKMIGNTAYKYYMLFQHHTSIDEDAHESDPSWILGARPGPFITQKNHSNYVRLGREISLVGFDCRTERKLTQIISPSTYKNIFDRLKKEIAGNTDIKHLLVMLGVPILYPRLVWLEWLLTSSALKPVRSLAQKGVLLNKGLVNEFDGDIEVLDDLNDHWCSRHHKAERNRLIRDLLQFGAEHGVRITILSGDVHLACVSRIKSKYHKYASAHLIRNREGAIDESNLVVSDTPEYDPRLIFNIISSAIINAPPPDGMANLLNRRTKIHHFNRHTQEDVVPIFLQEPKGGARDNHRFLNKRNWSDLVLAKQSMYKKDLSENDENPVRKFPQPQNATVKDKKTDDIWCKYPLRSDSLVTTIHVEQDGTDYEAKTTGYEVLIPRLIGNWKLETAKIKHLD